MELAAHACATGTKVFEVNYGTKYVKVVLASLATERLANGLTASPPDGAWILAIARREGVMV